jgi:hypothetical protein
MEFNGFMLVGVGVACLSAPRMKWSSLNLMIGDSKFMPQPTNPSLLYDQPGLPDANPTAVPDAMLFKTS